MTEANDNPVQFYVVEVCTATILACIERLVDNQQALILVSEELLRRKLVVNVKVLLKLACLRNFGNLDFGFLIIGASDHVEANNPCFFVLNEHGHVFIFRSYWKNSFAIVATSAQIGN